VPHFGVVSLNAKCLILKMFLIKSLTIYSIAVSVGANRFVAYMEFVCIPYDSQKQGFPLQHLTDVSVYWNHSVFSVKYELKLGI